MVATRTDPAAPVVDQSSPGVGARMALCHEWLTTFGGSEVVASHIASALDIEDIYSFAVDDSLASGLFPGKRVESASRIGRSVLARRHWQWFLGAMPAAWRKLDVSDYDVVITSSHACVNSVRTRPDAIHISYCHTPMRYAWNYESEIERIPRVVRPLWPAVAARLRDQDRRRAENVTRFIANSRNVAARIARCYGRESDVIYPPIDTNYWSPDPSVEKQEFFLLAGRLVPYKRPELAVRAAQLAGVPLVVAGAGPMLDQLRAMDTNHVRFVESPSRSQLRTLYRQAQALVFPGEEDFGMTMVEAQACGTPVVALGRGGALETVVHASTGHLYKDDSVESLTDALCEFSGNYREHVLTGHADRFSVVRFRKSMRESVAQSIGLGRDACEATYAS